MGRADVDVRYPKVININLVGRFNMIRVAADATCENAPEGTGERGVLVPPPAPAPATAQSAEWPVRPDRMP